MIHNKQMFSLKTAIVALATLGMAHAMAQQPVGTLSVVREVQVSAATVMENRGFLDARDGQQIRNNYGVRTKRRSHALINFFDHSQLRVNENTDMVVNDSATRRLVQLNRGAVWVKVAKGVNTSIQTPTATATARGTEFEVLSSGETLVYEGSVEVTIDGQTVVVQAGQKLSVDSDGKVTSSTPVPLDPGEVPEGRGGGTQTWFTSVPTDAGIIVGPGGTDYTQTRTNPLNDSPKKGTIGDLSVIIRGPHPNVATDPRSELGLLDDTITNYLFPAIAAAISVAADHDDLADTRLPGIRRSAYAFAGDPGFAGLRVNASGLVGASRYEYEANAIQFYHDPETRALGRFGSVLYLERHLNDELKVFAGRKKFYYGPIFTNSIDTQLVADRYTAAGAHWDKKALGLELAYLYDGNRYVSGVQPGYIGSVSYKLYGGVVSGQFLESHGVSGYGHGRSATLSMPLVRNVFDIYGEVGTGIDGNQNRTYGFYLPKLFQQTGVNLYGEYALKETVSQAYSLTATYEIPKGPQLRASIESVSGTSRANFGLSTRF